jgi:indole-3-glycerol phosphate synthase
MKKASPSAGLLRPDYRPAEIGALYEERGAAGISILTEPRHFLGTPEHVQQVRAVVDLPILRKDFMCDAYQVWEAAAWGADVILLIVAALDAAELTDLHAVAQEAGLDVLVESHTAAEVELALALDDAIIGVNSRNLKTLKTDLQVAVDLAPVMPPDRICVAESGIKTRADIEMLLDVGYNGFLIGEALMSEGDPAAKLGELLGCPA